MLFEGSGWVVFSACAGTVLLWCKEGYGQRRVYSLSRLVERLPWLGKSGRYILQFAIFVAFGTFVALLLTEPETAKQAFAAGLGWTALTTGVQKQT